MELTSECTRRTSTATLYFYEITHNKCPQCPLKRSFSFDFRVFQAIIRCRCADWAVPPSFATGAFGSKNGTALWCAGWITESFLANSRSFGTAPSGIEKSPYWLPAPDSVSLSSHCLPTVLTSTRSGISWGGCEKKPLSSAAINPTVADSMFAKLLSTVSVPIPPRS